MNTGTKTTTPVPYPKAKSIYDKLVNEKTGKGYSPGADGIRYQSTSKEERSTGTLPQLLNPITADEVEALLNDDRFLLQEKFDGRRTLIQISSSGVRGINRNGLTIDLPETIAHTASAYGQELLLDGELLGEIYIAFDLLEANGENLRNLSCQSRLTQLTQICTRLAYPIQLAETVHGSKAKKAYYQKLLEKGKEGAVFKDANAHYAPGRPASGGSQFKYKFYETASFIVYRINDQRSVSLDLQNDSIRIPAGNVTIPPNRPIPRVGAVVEVRYLYAFPESGHVYQPVYLGERSDITHSQCTPGQLKFKKPTNE